MKEITILYLSLADLCQATDTPSETLIEITDEGIIEPVGNHPANWQFSVRNVSVVQKAVRLHRDLSIDWPGIALAMSLIEELEKIRSENQQLKRRLQRFNSPNRQ
ncbi:MAG: chaperone modulatory protein CbpM [Halioglobus sp.]|jgi:chaperone modulatory protein CbpM